jgi:PAS domain S-box-containing protein
MLDQVSNLPRLRELLQQLHGEETHLERFFQLSPDMFCIADSTAKFVKLNLAWTIVLGWTREELKASTFFDFIHPDDHDSTLAVLGRMTVESIANYRNRYRHRDGHYVTLNWSATRWADGFTYAAARPVPEVCLDCNLVLPARSVPCDQGGSHAS